MFLRGHGRKGWWWKSFLKSRSSLKILFGFQFVGGMSYIFLVVFIFLCYIQKHWEIAAISKMVVCHSPHSWKMSNLDVHLLTSWRESSILYPRKGKSFFSVVTEMALSSRKCKPSGTLILCKFSCSGLSPADRFTLWFCLNAVEGSRMYNC